MKSHRNTTAIYPFEGSSGWNPTTAMAEETIQSMEEINAVAPDKPFLVCFVPGGTHAPHYPTLECRAGSEGSGRARCVGSLEL